MNSTDRAYEGDKILLEFAGNCNCDYDLGNYTLEDYNEAIVEYEMLLQEAIKTSDKEQIKMLRREIQQTKAEKRKVKRLINIKNSKEIATT